MTYRDAVLDRCLAGHRLDADEALALDAPGSLEPLLEAAESLALAGFGARVSYSRKVFIPLTQLCRDVCGYCTFSQAPRRGERAYLSEQQVLEIAAAGAAAGCEEALFTLGDKPELRFAVARQELQALGHATTIEYLEAAARTVIERTGLLPHLNPGVLSGDDLERLRPASVSMGMMLESASSRLLEKGGAHWRSPDKAPDRRLETLRAAGELGVPFTTGILVGIGETRRERLEALLAIREVHERYGHIQEVIVQNFRAKPGTRMSGHAEPSLEDYLWTLAVARLVLGPRMSIQAPPNLSPGALGRLVRAGINDWGGVSPVTPDHVNPEAPWPHLAALEGETALAGRALVPRLAIVPAFAREPERWLPEALRPAVLRRIDALGFARRDGWYAGLGGAPPEREKRLIEPVRSLSRRAGAKGSREIRALARRMRRGEVLREHTIASLFAADGPDLSALAQAADELRAGAVGPPVTYVVNRNINYTNICTYSCGFCAFAKGRSSHSLRGPGYDLDLEEIARRSREAHERGATEVCLQGGIHPRYDGDTYLGIVRAVKQAVPALHVHAFSPLEVTHGARTLGVSIREFLEELKRNGLASLPGTAAEILDDEVRAVICPDKLKTGEWLEVMRTAHGIGLRSTATIMFGHADSPLHWARHLLRIRALQAETGGFTEMVPLPFVHQEAPLWRKGRARSGPTFREALLMHAVARLVLHPLVVNIQTSWVKMGTEGAALALRAGANDLGGTLMNESITRAAGGIHGQEQRPSDLEAIAARAGRPVRQRTTFYGPIERDATPSKLCGAPLSASA
jgi:FO synthase